MKICSYCGHSNEDARENCTECGTQLQSSPPPEDNAADPANAPLVVVESFATHEQASILAARLEQAGIEACIPEEYTSQVFPNIFPLVRVTVRVAAVNAEAAKAIAAGVELDPPEVIGDPPGPALNASEEHKPEAEKKQDEPMNRSLLEKTMTILILMSIGAGALAHFFQLAGAGAALLWVWAFFSAGCLFSCPCLARRYLPLARVCLIITLFQLISFLVLFTTFDSGAKAQVAEREPIRNKRDW